MASVARSLHSCSQAWVYVSSSWNESSQPYPVTSSSGPVRNVQPAAFASRIDAMMRSRLPCGEWRTAGRRGTESCEARLRGACARTVRSIAHWFRLHVATRASGMAPVAFSLRLSSAPSTWQRGWTDSRKVSARSAPPARAVSRPRPNMVRRWQGELSVWSNSRQKYKSQGTFEAHLPPGVTLPSILEFDQPVSKEEVEMRAGTPVDITLSAESERYRKSLMAMETTFDNRKVLPARRTDDAPPSMLIIGMEIGPPLKLTLHVGGAEVELREAGEAKARHASNGASNGAGNGAASSNGAGNGANANVAPSVGVKRPRDDEHNKNNEGEREPRIDSEWLKGMDVEVKTNFFRLNVGDGLVVTQ